EYAVIDLVPVPPEEPLPVIKPRRRTVDRIFVDWRRLLDHQVVYLCAGRGLRHIVYSATILEGTARDSDVGRNSSDRDESIRDRRQLVSNARKAGCIERNPA